MNGGADRGLVIGIGGTNARVALTSGGKLENFTVDATPRQPEQFFGWMAERIVQAASDGAEWAVVGIPGPVSELEGRHAIGPLVNVPGLIDKAHTVEDELAKVSPKTKQLLKRGFALQVVNDGVLSAFAAAELYANGEQRYNMVASCIIGTGVGGAIVRRQRGSNIFRPSESLFEIGHVPLQHDHQVTFETTISGTALQKRHGVRAEDMDADHEAWSELGRYVGQLAMIIGIVGGADLIVTCGGVGSNAYEHYRPYMEEYLEKFRVSHIGAHRLAVPKVISVSPQESQTFEMRGAEGVMRYNASAQKAERAPRLQ